MLVLTRIPGEAIVLGEDAEVHLQVSKVIGQSVQFKLCVPDGYAITPKKQGKEKQVKRKTLSVKSHYQTPQ